MFLSKTFIVSGITYRSLESVFVYDVRKCFDFILLKQICPVFPAPLIEETIFSPLYILASFVKDKVLISGLSILFH